MDGESERVGGLVPALLAAFAPFVDRGGGGPPAGTDPVRGPRPGAFWKAKALGFVILLGLGLSAGAQDATDDEEQGVVVPGIIWAVERAICIAECVADGSIRGATAVAGALSARNLAVVIRDSTIQNAQGTYLACGSQAGLADSDMAPLLNAACDSELRTTVDEARAAYGASVRQIAAQLAIEGAQIALQVAVCSANCIARWTRW